jgi:hypothetical protein
VLAPSARFARTPRTLRAAPSVYAPADVRYPARTPRSRPVKRKAQTMNYYLIDFENVGSEELKKIKSFKKGSNVILFYTNKCKSIAFDTLSMMKKQGVKLSYQNVKAGKNALDIQLASYLGYLIGTCGEKDKFHVVSKDKDYDCVVAFWKKKDKQVDRLEPLDMKGVVATSATGAKSASGAKSTESTATAAKGSGSAAAKGNGSTAAKGNGSTATATKKPAAAKTPAPAAAKGTGSKVAKPSASAPASKKSKVAPSDRATLAEVKALLSADEQPSEVLDIINAYKTKLAINNGLVKLLKDTKKAGAIYGKLKPLLKKKNKS